MISADAGASLASWNNGHTRGQAMYEGACEGTGPLLAPSSVSGLCRSRSESGSGGDERGTYKHDGDRALMGRNSSHHFVVGPDGSKN